MTPYESLRRIEVGLRLASQSGISGASGSAGRFLQRAYSAPTALALLLVHLTVFRPCSATETVVELPGGIELEIVWIEPGIFEMGTRDPDVFRQQDEQPAHEVTISRGFYLGKYEITQSQWTEVMETRPWQGRDPTTPLCTSPGWMCSCSWKG